MFGSVLQQPHLWVSHLTHSHSCLLAGWVCLLTQTHTHTHSDNADWQRHTHTLSFTQTYTHTLTFTVGVWRLWCVQQQRDGHLMMISALLWRTSSFKQRRCEKVTFTEEIGGAERRWRVWHPNVCVSDKSQSSGQNVWLERGRQISGGQECRHRGIKSLKVYPPLLAFTIRLTLWLTFSYFYINVCLILPLLLPIDGQLWDSSVCPTSDFLSNSFSACSMSLTDDGFSCGFESLITAVVVSAC